MAALRNVVARPGISAILRALRAPSPRSYGWPCLKIQERCSSFMSSPKFEDPSKYTDFEITKDPKEWFYVERIMRMKVVPEPPKSTDKELPSGWKPQSESAKNHPFFVARSKNHMHPVYLSTTFRGMRRITQVRRIQGDIWALNDLLKKHIEKTIDKAIMSQVHELAGQINFRGDHVNIVKKWLEERGF